MVALSKGNASRTGARMVLCINHVSPACVTETRLRVTPCRIVMDKMSEAVQTIPECATP